MTNIAEDPTVAASVDNLINNVIGGTEHEGEAELKLPHILALGAAYQLTEKLRCELNLVHFGWSTFDELVLDFGNEYLDSTIEEDYEDIWQIRCGVSLDVNEKLTLLGGYVYDETPPAGRVHEPAAARRPRGMTSRAAWPTRSPTRSR